MIVLFSDLRTFFDKIPIPIGQRIAFIPNARDTYENNDSLKTYKDFLESRNKHVEYVDLKEYSGDDLFSKLSSFDVVYVTGGNSFYLLELVRKSGLDAILPKLLDKGIVYLGESAGAVIMSNSIEPTGLMDYPEFSDLKDYVGLDYLDFVFLPHSDEEKYMPKIDAIEKEFSKTFALKKFSNSQGLMIDDNGAMTFID